MRETGNWSTPVRTLPMRRLARLPITRTAVASGRLLQKS